jgi:hypothetical protein
MAHATHSRFYSAERGNSMSDWLRHLNDAKFAVKQFDQPGAQKSLAALEQAVTVALHGKNKEEAQNSVTMSTTPPYGILQRPDPVCTHCGMVMQVRHTGGLTYVIDHGASSSPGCPNDFKMWKMTAAYIPYDEQVFVPPFVRDAMAKNS